jgi:integrase
MTQSNAKSARAKPPKPYENFPLFPHASGRWAKKIRGQLEYFGSWEDGWQNALDNYQAWKDDLYAGRRPTKSNLQRVTIRDLCNAFRASKESKLLTGELVQHTFNDYLDSMNRIIHVFGKTVAVEDLRPDDFAKLRAHIAKSFKTPQSLGNEINRCRVIFNFAKKNRLVSDVWFGDDFKRPSRSIIRRTRAQKRQVEGAMMFEADEVLALLKESSGQYKAMTLLAVNCGLDGASIGQLPTSALNLEDRWLDFPRFKTGIERQCPLWPETVAALMEAAGMMPAPKAGNEHLFFRTKYGTGWYKGKSCPLSQEFRKLMEAADVYRRGRGFRALRHTFETVASGSRDQIAVDHIMGHEAGSMAATYRERIERDRLQAVVDHVHDWLWSPKPKGKRGAANPNASKNKRANMGSSPDRNRR